MAMESRGFQRSRRDVESVSCDEVELEGSRVSESVPET